MLGLQKDLNAETSIRFGVNYGSSPIKSDDVDNNLASIAIPALHLSVGASRRFNKNLLLSIAYTHAFKNELVSSSGSGNTIDIEQNILYLQFSYIDWLKLALAWLYRAPIILIYANDNYLSSHPTLPVNHG